MSHCLLSQLLIPRDLALDVKLLKLYLGLKDLNSLAQLLISLYPCPMIHSVGISKKDRAATATANPKTAYSRNRLIGLEVGLISAYPVNAQTAVGLVKLLNEGLIGEEFSLVVFRCGVKDCCSRRGLIQRVDMVVF